ncbi:Protein of unknown function [Bacillus mycoides]|nr:Protein of unknown function [Bacillus mycoides]
MQKKLSIQKQCQQLLDTHM